MAAGRVDCGPRQVRQEAFSFVSGNSNLVRSRMARELYRHNHDFHYCGRRAALQETKRNKVTQSFTVDARQLLPSFIVILWLRGQLYSENRSIATCRRRRHRGREMKLASKCGQAIGRGGRNISPGSPDSGSPSPQIGPRCQCSLAGLGINYDIVTTGSSIGSW